MHEFTATLLSLARCKRAAVPTALNLAAVPLADVYLAAHMAYGLSTGQATGCVREALATGEVRLSLDGKSLHPTAVIAPRSMADCEAGAELADVLYTRLNQLRDALGVEDAILPFIE